MAQENKNRDPTVNYSFGLLLGNIEVGHFQEFSGLKTAANVFEIEEGGVNGYTHKRPGPSKYENIVLRYGTNLSQELWEWRERFLQDGFKEQTEKSVSVIVYDNHRNEVRRYNFMRAWPVSWEGPELAASGSEIAMESLEFAFDRLRID